MANVATAVFILFNAVFQTAQCYPGGAPSTECASMTPSHGVSAQSGTSPYSVKTEKPYYMLEENVKVSIESSSDDIKGYLIQQDTWSKSRDYKEGPLNSKKRKVLSS